MRNFDIFETFIRERSEFNDWSCFLSRDQKSLSRAKILNQCKIPRSALYQNKKIVDRIRSIESELEEIGILKSAAKAIDVSEHQEAIKEVEALTRTVENELAILDSEIDIVRSSLLAFPLPR